MFRYIMQFGRSGILALAAGAVFSPEVASAANRYWDGTGASWDVPASWSTASGMTTPNPLFKPGAADTAIFNITTVNTPQTINLDATQSALGLVFNSSGSVLIQSGAGGPNTLTLGAGGISSNVGTGADTISSPVSLAASQTWLNDGNKLTVSGNIANGANLLTIDGAGATTISGVLGNGSGGLTKNGDGLLVLSNNNTFTGDVTINDGTLRLDHAGALNSATPNAVAFGAGSTGVLSLNGNSVTVSSLSTNASVGTLILSGANSYTGTTTINAGKLQGDTGSLHGNIANNATLAFNQSANGSFAGAISGTGGVTINGSTVTFNSTNTYSGTTTVSVGTLAIEGAGSIVGTSAISIGDGSLDTELKIGLGGWVSVGGNVFLGFANPGSYRSTLTINGGTLNVGGNILRETDPFEFGFFNFTSGTLGFTGAADINLALVAFAIGADTLGPNQTVNVTNIAFFDSHLNINKFRLNGGTLNVGSLQLNDNFIFTSGTLGLTGPGGVLIGNGGLFGSSVVFNANQTFNVTNTLTINSGAYLAAAGGLSAGNLVNNGDLVVISSAVNGPVINNSAVTVVGSVDFNGPVSGPGNFYGPGTAHFNGGLAPGASPANVSFEGNLALADTNTLFIELAGTTPGSEYDRLTITGSATLDGILNVSLINGFMPTGGQQFTILTAGSITNNGFELAGSAASLFTLLVSSTSVILQATGVPGDYNANGVVDAADYVLWRNGGPLQNEVDTPGVVNAADYTAWRARFGNSGSGAGANINAAVPEPATTVLLMFAAAAGVCSRRRRAA